MLAGHPFRQEYLLRCLLYSYGANRQPGSMYIVIEQAVLRPHHKQPPTCEVPRTHSCNQTTKYLAKFLPANRHAFKLEGIRIAQVWGKFEGAHCGSSDSSVAISGTFKERWIRAQRRRQNLYPFPIMRKTERPAWLLYLVVSCSMLRWPPTLPKTSVVYPLH